MALASAANSRRIQVRLRPLAGAMVTRTARIRDRDRVPIATPRRGDGDRQGETVEPSKWWLLRPLAEAMVTRQWEPLRDRAEILRPLAGAMATRVLSRGPAVEHLHVVTPRTGDGDRCASWTRAGPPRRCDPHRGDSDSVAHRAARTAV